MLRDEYVAAGWHAFDLADMALRVHEDTERLGDSLTGG